MSEQRRTVLDMRKQGFSFREIGEALGISRQYANHLVLNEHKTMVTKRCLNCGARVQRNVQYPVSLCADCSKVFMVNTYGHGLSGRDRTRELVRIRDNHTCQEKAGGCGKVWIPGQRRFDIHHTGGGCGKFTKSYDRTKDLSKMVTLCHKCHLGLPENRKKMSDRGVAKKNGV